MPAEDFRVAITPAHRDDGQVDAARGGDVAHFVADMDGRICRLAKLLDERNTLYQLKVLRETREPAAGAG